MPRVAMAQARTTSAVTQQSANGDVALSRYNAEKKSTLEAVFKEAILPLWGNAYAGNKSRGYTPLAVSAAGLALTIVGVAKASKMTCDGYVLNNSYSCHHESGVFLPLGMLTYAGGRIWGLVRANNTAVDHNLGLQRQYGLR
ncbi:hypothetical protein KW796_00820 [Candidatus Parcubacteria bacterium]|nr:hypothetical protein [Candidatus Parcubacteria bacterium]